MSRIRIPLFALALSGLPLALSAQEVTRGGAAVTGAQILACEADRAAEGCATLLSQLFVCDRAEAMEGCADLLALREAALMDEATAEAEAEGIVPEPGAAAEDLEVEVRAEGELSDESDSDNEADSAGNGAIGGCPVLASDGWAAWVNAMPGSGEPRLIVTGTVTLPTPGYTVTFELGDTEISERVVQDVDLTAAPPEGVVAQVLSEYALRLDVPSLEMIDANTAPYGAVRVVCGEQEIARIEPVEVAQ